MTTPPQPNRLQNSYLSRAKRSSQLLSGAVFNADQTRYCVPSREGIACYRGNADKDGNWHGTLEGIAKSQADADRYLEGAFVELVPLRRSPSQQ